MFHHQTLFQILLLLHAIKAQEKKKKTEHIHASRRMEHGECDGWAYIWIMEGNPLVKISVKHNHTRLPYEDTSLLEKWKEFIHMNLEMSFTKVHH